MKNNILNFGKALVFAIVLGLVHIASGSTLSQLAGSMKEGEWAELKTEGFNLGEKNILDRCVHSMLAFNDAVQWDSTAGHMYILGSGHGEWASGDCIGFVRYDEATNSWTTLEKPPFYAEIHHAWDHTTFIPEKREFYHKTSITERLYKYDIKTEVWTFLSSTFDTYMDCRYGSLEYFPEMNGLFWYQAPYVFDLVSQTWKEVFNPFATENTNYNVFAEYNKRHKLLIAGGGNGSTKLYQVDSLGKFSKKNLAPFALGMNSSIQFADPNTGLFVIYDMASRKLYHYDVVNDIWTLKTEVAPLLNDYQDYANLVGGYINTHNVGIFIQWKGVNSKIWLYKPYEPTTTTIHEQNAIESTPRLEIHQRTANGTFDINSSNINGAEIVVHDIKGKLIKRWKLDRQSKEKLIYHNTSSSKILIFSLIKGSSVLSRQSVIVKY